MEKFEVKAVGDMEIPPNLIPNLIDWMRRKHISDSDILDCVEYICTQGAEVLVECD